MHHQDPSLTYELACSRRDDLLPLGAGTRQHTINVAGSFVRRGLLAGRRGLGVGLVQADERLSGEVREAQQTAEGTSPAALHSATSSAN